MASMAGWGSWQPPCKKALSIAKKRRKHRLFFAILKAVLRLHLALEDHVLYPALLQSETPGVAARAKEFQEEMGGLLPVVVGFVERWYSVNAIREDETLFREKAAELLQALSNRVRRENEELYPMVEKVVV